MKIAFASDLHLEFGGCDLVGEADLLVLAGDTVIVDDIKRFPFNNTTKDLASTKFGNSQGYYEFFETISERFNQVVIVLGNHEHYHGKFNKSYQILKENVESEFSNIKVLENEVLHLNDSTMLLAATLWASMGFYNHEHMQVIESTMNDYKKITYNKDKLYRRLRAKDTIEAHYSTLRFFREQLAANKDKKAIIATHHAPSMQSAYPKALQSYNTELLTAYASNLEEFILEYPQITHWIHGHVHDVLDYRVGECRILCNPRGYYGYEHYDVEHRLKVIEL